MRAAQRQARRGRNPKDPGPMSKWVPKDGGESLASEVEVRRVTYGELVGRWGLSPEEAARIVGVDG